MEKVFFAGLLVMFLILSLSVVVCAETVTLRVAWWGSQSRHNRTLKVIDMFKEQYPDIKIDPQYTGWGGYWEKMAAQAAGNNLPDVMQHDRMYLTQYVDNGRILSLNKYLNNGILDLSNVDQGMGEVDGQLYGVTLGVNAFAVTYHEKLFEEAGVDLPDPDWTWQDFMNTARKLHDELGIYGSTLFPGAYRDIFGLRIWLRQHGKSLYNEDASGLGYEDDALFANFFQMFNELENEGVVAPPALLQEIGSNVEMDPFNQNKAAMSSLWSNQIVAASTASGEKVDLTVMPNGENEVKKGLFIKPSMYFTVSKNSEYPEAAAKFINFFINNVAANVVLSAGRGVPVSAAVREAMKAKLDEVNKEQFEYIDLASRYSSDIYAPPPDVHNQIVDHMKTLVNKILYDVITPTEAAKEFRIEAEKFLQNE